MYYGICFIIYSENTLKSINAKSRAKTFFATGADSRRNFFLLLQLLWQRENFSLNLQELHKTSIIAIYNIINEMI